MSLMSCWLNQFTDIDNITRWNQKKNVKIINVKISIINLMYYYRWWRNDELVGKKPNHLAHIMLTEQLSTRQDLIQSLDSDAIFDYLIQHGVLDEETCDGILQENNREKRNTALLHHLESTGKSAIGLFINALRQSGQLTLASSLDKHRIKPTYGKGLLEFC
jgi:hypothetical protein